MSPEIMQSMLHTEKFLIDIDNTSSESSGDQSDQIEPENIDQIN